VITPATFIRYRCAAEKRRQLRFDVGEANARLIAAMTAGGFTEEQARQADVRAGTGGQYRPVSQIAKRS